MADHRELERRRIGGGRVSARARFETAMVTWLNSRFVPKGIVITADTPLFTKGLIDSLGILELIAWTEVNTGQIVPDERIRMDNFRTVARIARAFVPEEVHANG
jgi:acyl carrier protein